MEDIEKIIQKYEVPKELHDALWDAYQAGAKRGYIDGAITEFNTPIIKDNRNKEKP